MMDAMTTLTGQQIADEGLNGWAYLLGRLQTRIATPDFTAGLALIAAIGAAAGQAGPQPDVDLRHTHVDVRLTSRDEFGVSARDIELARTITALAADAGLRPDASVVSRLEIALDTPDRTKVLAFWQAVTGLAQSDDPVWNVDLHDPADVLPALWFQQSGDEEPRQRWHHDLWVDPAEVQPRLDAAIAAGGRLVSDAKAPAYWILADPEGNQICLCTWQSRDD
jgi:4a-hydroxytetrahydrobiopterin dehydratase